MSGGHVKKAEPVGMLGSMFSAAPRMIGAAIPRIQAAVQPIKAYFGGQTKLGPALADAVTGLQGGGQIDRAANRWKATPGNYFERGLSAFGGLSNPARGAIGGGLGALGAAALSPKGTRGYTMPLATGLGAWLGSAAGPNGFDPKNLLTTQALTTGALGLGAGWLGSKLMGDDDDEDEDEDPTHPHRRRHRSGGGLMGSILPVAAGAGLGAGLMHYMGQPGAKPPAAPPPAAAGIKPAPNPAGQPQAVPGNANQAPGNVNQAPVDANQAPGNVNQAPVDANQAPGNATKVGPGQPLPVPPPAAPLAPVRPAPTAKQVFTPPPTVNDNFHKQILNQIRSDALLPATERAPATQVGMRNFLNQALQATAGRPENPNIPDLSQTYSDYYRTGDPNLLAKAQGYINVLNPLAESLGHKWSPVSSIESQLGAVNRQTMARDPGNLSSLGLFGFKSIDDLAQAAAQGNPSARHAVESMSPEAQNSLINALSVGTTKIPHPTEGEIPLPLYANNPNAAALHGLTSHVMSPYRAHLDPSISEPARRMALEQVSKDRLAQLPALSPADLQGDLMALDPAKKQSLTAMLNSSGDNDQLRAMLQGMPPEQAQGVLRNLARAHQRTAYPVYRDIDQQNLGIPDQEVGKPFPAENYLDRSMQQRIADLAGVKDFIPIEGGDWSHMMRGRRGASDNTTVFSPYRGNRLLNATDLQRMSTPPEGGGATVADLMFNDTPENRSQVVNQWRDLLTGNDAATNQSLADPQTANALVANLQAMKKFNLPLYEQLVAALPEAAVDGRSGQSTKWRDHLESAQQWPVNRLGTFTPPPDALPPDAPRTDLEPNTSYSPYNSHTFHLRPPPPRLTPRYTLVR